MLEIGVIGAGNVGGTLGRRWAQAGHKVVFGGLCRKLPKTGKFKLTSY
jgi:predicted dinucleotide-binding enzyme